MLESLKTLPENEITDAHEIAPISEKAINKEKVRFLQCFLTTFRT
jgi:hypothetical protein